VIYSLNFYANRFYSVQLEKILFLQSVRQVKKVLINVQELSIY